MTKLLVVDPGNDDVEVIDLNDPSRNCQLPDLPYSMSVMGAGFTSSGPMVCSGYYSNYETSAGNCYGLSAKNQFVKLSGGLIPRSGASSIVTEDGQLIMIGGRRSWSWSDMSTEKLKNSEILNVFESKIEKGFELPEAVSSHCSIRINATTAMVLGGGNKTYYVDLVTFQVTNGPEMLERRHSFGCALLRHNNQDFVIAAGGFRKDTTEFLNLESGTWSKG